ncbi:hypothetical protein J6590_010514 [Homalodisca vitripennis]|nr:hypothetical protein J6590_010514 [Homalodisca vitripennis]
MAPQIKATIKLSSGAPLTRVYVVRGRKMAPQIKATIKLSSGAPLTRVYVVRGKMLK